MLIKRARASRFADLGRRIGYTLFGVAMLGFIYGFATNFSEAATKDDIEHGRDIG